MISSQSLPQQAQVVIVGGGVMGASTAFHLAEAGVEGVVLLERDELAAGSTSRSAGGVRAQFSDPVNVALGARSLTAFEQFAHRPGADIDLHQVGYLFLHTDPASLAAAKDAVALQNSMGVPTRMLTGAEAGQLSPGVRTVDVLGATFHPRDGYCAPEAVVQGYARAARRHGAQVLTGVEVTAISTSGGEITSVQTSVGTIRTSAVVCAAGAWSRPLAAGVGVDLPIDPLRRQIVVTEPLGAELLARFPESMPMTIDAATTCYVHREGPGILLGMSYQDQTVGFDQAYAEDWLPALWAAMEQRVPELLEVGIAHRWGGLYEVTPDDNAVIGEDSGIARFLYAAGFSGHGFLQGPAIGEIMRDLWLGRTPVIDVSSLHADRFLTGAQVTELAIV